MSAEEQARATVAEVMTPLREGLVMAADASLAEALARMVQEDADRLLVMEKNRMAGMITKTSLLRFVQIKQILEK
jgi:predicted transcriptional regulator